jgi:hypothetical protein
MNQVQAYAVDTSGNASLTNRVKFTSLYRDWAPEALSGLMAELTPDGEAPFVFSAGASTFSESMAPGTNEANNGVGNYTYIKLGTNTAQFTFEQTAPPSIANHTNRVDLTFTNTYTGVFVTTNEQGTSSGGVRLFAATNTAPASLVGETIHLVAGDGSSTNTVFLGDGVFMETNPSGTANSGTYTFMQYSSAGAMVVLTYTSPSDLAGAVKYLELTSSSSVVGDYFSTFFDNSGGGPSTSAGAFTMP